MRIAFILMAVLCVNAAIAEENLTQDYRADSDICIEAADYLGDEANCRGLLFQACRVGHYVEPCMMAEAIYWDIKMKNAFDGATAELRRQDLLYSLPTSLVAGLRRSQAAWLRFKEQHCQFEFEAMGSDAGCLEKMNFERTMVLIDLQAPVQ